MTEKAGISKHIKIALIDKGLTQVELAKNSNMPLQSLRNQLCRDTFTVKKLLRLPIY